MASLLVPSRPFTSLTLAFLLWKALVFIIVVTCPGPGYDTSTGLLPYQASRDVIPDTANHAWWSSLLLKFTRWDALYFVHIVERGYVFEQEWAFGYGYTRLLALLTSLLPRSEGISEAAQITAVAVALSHVSHYLAVLALYRLSLNVFGRESASQRLLAFLSAVLHIFSPAGAFLSAPYGEALTSFLNISGFYLYSSSFVDNRARKGGASNVKLLVAAALFAVATTVRSNGILGGVLFAHDALVLLGEIVSQGVSVGAVLRLGVTVLGGCIIGLGFVLPQVVAYGAYCTETVSRPWCQQFIPSIYGWVQGHYWNVGFLRYWTVSNIPLFLMALPMLFFLCWSSLWAVREGVAHDLLGKAEAKPGKGSVADTGSVTGKGSVTDDGSVTTALLRRFAIPQALLAVMALTSYHVQIINRISSAYPLWYWYLAYQILKEEQRFPVVVPVMVMYGLIQAVLFGSFLPPA